MKKREREIRQERKEGPENARSESLSNKLAMALRAWTAGRRSSRERRPESRHRAAGRCSACEVSASVVAIVVAIRLCC